MRNLRIHVVNKYFFPVTAGIETNLMEVYSKFAKSGHHITMHASRSTLSETNTLRKREKINGINVVRYDHKWFGFVPKIPLNEVDVISLHNFTISPNVFLMFLVAIIKILGKKKFILMLSPQSGFIPDWNSIPKSKAILKRFFHQTIGRVLINYSADGIRVISEWEKKEMIKAGIRKDLIELIGHGTNEISINTLSKVNSKFKKKIQDFKPYTIQIGRIHPVKNYEISIKAFAKMPHKYTLVIIGPIENKIYFEKLQKLIKDLKIRDRVVFLHALTEAEKFFALKSAEAMVHMSRHEGYCIAVHEAMSQGLVCIVSNATALPEIVIDGVNGYCLDPNDSEGVYKKLKFITDEKNVKKVDEIKNNNLFFTKNITWSQVAKKIEEFYINTYKKSV